MMQPTLFCDDTPPIIAPARHKSAINEQDQAAVMQWLPMLRGKAKRFKAAQHADDEDNQQEAALAAVLAVGTYRGDVSQLQTHLGSAAEYRLRTIERKRKRRGMTGDTGTIPRLSTIGEDWDVEDRREAFIRATVEDLRRAYSALPHDEYLVIIHRRVSEMTGAEVAALLGVTVDEVDRIEAAAMERLASLLGG